VVCSTGPTTFLVLSLSRHHKIVTFARWYINAGVASVQEDKLKNAKASPRDKSPLALLKHHSGIVFAVALNCTKRLPVTHFLNVFESAGKILCLFLVVGTEVDAKRITNKNRALVCCKRDIIVARKSHYISIHDAKPIIYYTLRNSAKFVV